jgi:hypothetical protein
MQEKELFNAIDAILWTDWDPISLNDKDDKDNDWPNDEYRSYVPQILKLKQSGADEEAIAKELNALADKIVGPGKSSSIEHYKKIAAKIISL